MIGIDFGRIDDRAARIHVIARAIEEPPLYEHLRAPRPRVAERRELVAGREQQLMIDELRALQVEAVGEIRADEIGERRGARRRDA